MNCDYLVSSILVFTIRSSYTILNGFNTIKLKNCVKVQPKTFLCKI